MLAFKQTHTHTNTQLYLRTNNSLSTITKSVLLNQAVQRNCGYSHWVEGREREAEQGEERERKRPPPPPTHPKWQEHTGRNFPPKIYSVNNKHTKDTPLSLSFSLPLSLLLSGKSNNREREGEGEKWWWWWC